MIIGFPYLHTLVKDQSLVEGLSDRELHNPEGAGFDLRLGKVHTISGEAFLGIEERKTADSKTIVEYQEGKTQSITIQPTQFYLVTTIEKVTLPATITANMWLRSTLYRSGIIMSGGNAAPGYSGELSFALYNAGPASVTIELGARIVHILFYELNGAGKEYRGQWKGGRVSTSILEKQV